MEIEQYLYDLNDSGDAIVAYTMRSASGGSVQLCNLGASLLSLTLPDKEGVLREIASGEVIYGVAEGAKVKDSFADKLWESRVEFNRVIMSLSFEISGATVTSELVFDFDDEDSFEITYQAYSDSDNTPLDLSHTITINSDSAIQCAINGEPSTDTKYDISDAKCGILSRVAELHTEELGYPIELLSTHPSLYYDQASHTLTPASDPIPPLNEGTLYIQKCVYRRAR